MELYIQKLGSEFQEVLKSAKPQDIRKFFCPTKNLDELAVKVILWGHYFMPRYFNKPTPEFHYELVKIFFRPGNDYTACPRGFAKTTLNQLCIAYSCANGLDEFIVLIEKTYTEAAEVLEAVREEFKLGDDILRVYGNLTKVNTKGKDQENIKDSEGDFFVNGVRLRAKGFDTPIRGLKSRHSRPTRVIIDDCESDEHIDNVEQRQKYLNNYIKGVIPAVDNDTGVIKMFGTILHDDSLLNTLINNHNGKIYRAWDENRVLLWASNWTVEKLEQKRKEMQIEGKDASFYQEYFNEPLSDKDQIFRLEMFRYFNALQWEEIKKKPHRIYTLVDPAISKKTTADFTAIVTVAVDYMNRIFVLEITRERLDPIETIKVIFAHYVKWQPLYVGIETTAYQKALKYFIELEKHREKSIVQSMQIVEIRPTLDKITKITKLQPFYAIASVFHNSDDKNTSILEQELFRFPKGVHDDICLTSNTQVATMNGLKKISLIRKGEYVWTRQGLRKVTWAGKTGTKKVITKFGLSGTPNHRVWTENRGWVQLQLLKESDVVVCLGRQSCGMESNITGIRTHKGDSLENIFHAIQVIKHLLDNFTVMSGNFSMGKLKTGCMSIINSGRMTIDCLLSKWSLQMSTVNDTGSRLLTLNEGNGILESLWLNCLKLFSEEDVSESKKEEKKKKNKKGYTLQHITNRFHVNPVARFFAMLRGENIETVSHAEIKNDTLSGISQRRSIQKETVSFVGSIIPVTAKTLNFAERNANTNPYCVASGSVVDVYNLEVEDAHEYFANNILVHNCDCLSNVIEIMIPVSKTIDRAYKKYALARSAGERVMY